MVSRVIFLRSDFQTDSYISYSLKLSVSISLLLRGQSFALSVCHVETGKGSENALLNG